MCIRDRVRLLLKMGSSQSVEIPGGGTEGYHVLKVRLLANPYNLVSCCIYFCICNLIMEQFVIKSIKWKYLNSLAVTHCSRH